MPYTLTYLDATGNLTVMSFKSKAAFDSAFYLCWGRFTILVW